LVTGNFEVEVSEEKINCLLFKTFFQPYILLGLNCIM